MSKCALVTGGAGFIGAHVTRHLLRRGYRVVVLDDLSGGVAENVPKKAVLVVGSITDRDLLKRLFQTHKFDYVFHLAAYAAEGLSHFIRGFNYENNLLGSIDLINLSILHKVKRFVFTSSIAVYGKGQVPMSEDLIPQPEDPYGVAKLAVEMDLKAAHEMFGLKHTIFRPHNVYGELQNIGDRYRNVIGIFMNMLMQDKALPIFGDGEQTRAFSYIDEVAIPIVDSIDMKIAENETYNIGADTPYTVNRLATEVMKAMGKNIPIQYLPKRNEVDHAYSDHSKLRKHFKMLPAEVTLAEGLMRMADWALKVGPRKTELRMPIEIWEKMPASWLAELELQEKLREEASGSKAS